MMRLLFSLGLTVSFLVSGFGIPSRMRPAAGMDQLVWTQNSFADFKAGTLEEGGANLYITAAGQIRSIYTFDYNRDGSDDLLFVNGHNVYDAPPTYLYMNNGQGLDQRFRWALLNDGARSGLVADLNKDGFPDVVVCGTSNGMASRMPLDSIIYYGSDKGFFPPNSTRLPTFFPYSVTKADLNNDGWDDLVFPQSQSWAENTRRPTVVFWNGPDGFDDDRKSVLPIISSFVTSGDVNGDGRPDLVRIDEKGLVVYRGNGKLLDNEPMLRLEIEKASRCTLADLNGDRKPELIVAVDKPDAYSYIYWNDGGSFTTKRRTELPTTMAAGAAVGDLNGDGYPDVAFANTSLANGRKGEINSVVYWGSKDGFSAERKLELPTRWASACAIGDINGDGFADLVFANRTSLHRMDTESYVYWGSKEGLNPDRRQSLPSRGAADLAIGDVNGDHKTDLVIFNGTAGFNGERALRIYWNNGQGGFSTERKMDIQSYDSFSSVAADFNNDGFLDLAINNSYEYSIQGEGVDEGSFIYWGSSSSGFPTWDEKHLQKLKTVTASALVSGDLNRDGYLDLVIPQYGDAEKRQLIFWGGVDGYKNDRISTLHLDDPRGVTVADYNKDGWLDVVIATLTSPEIPIYWGGPDGYSDTRKTGLPNGGSVTVNSADFNNDGWLDLFVANFYESGKVRFENTNSFLYYGGPDGFSANRRTLLPSTGGDQTSVADFNKDGYLDIAIGNYATGGRDRTWFSFVYWNGPDGFKPSNRTDLYTNSGSGNLALDFNKDGWLDLLMACHKQANGDHSTYSYLFWGGPDGFQDFNKIELPTDGAHELTMMDPGNIYNRRFELGFISSVYDAGQPRRVKDISWKGEEKLGSKLRFELRGANSQEELKRTRWTPGPSGMSPSRFWQYRAVFTSVDGSNYPTLSEVTTTFE